MTEDEDRQRFPNLDQDVGRPAYEERGLIFVGELRKGQRDSGKN